MRWLMNALFGTRACGTTSRRRTPSLGVELLGGTRDASEPSGFLLPRPAYQPAQRRSFHQAADLCTEQLEERITPTVINNGLATATVGFFSANVQNAGVVSTAPGTYEGQSGTIFTNVNFIYQYKPFIQTTTSPTSIQLALTTIDSPVASTGPNSTSSSGRFTGSGGNQINWTVASTLAPNSTELISTTTFTATTGTLGSLRFVSYLDEDVTAGNGSGDDLLNPRNTPGTNAFVIGYFDGPQRVGFAQGGTQEAGTGLQNATYLGWAGGTFSGVENRIINKTQTFSVAGVIGDSLVQSTDPDLGTIFGPADVGSAMAWDALSTATSAVITTRLVQFATDAGAPPPAAPAPPIPAANPAPTPTPVANPAPAVITVPFNNNIIQALELPPEGQVQPGSAPSSVFLPPAGPTTYTFPTPVNNVPTTFGSFTFQGQAPQVQLHSGTNSTGVISGAVVRDAGGMDASERPAGVALILEVDRGGVFVAVATTTTDSNGQYSFNGLPSGNYRVRAASMTGVAISATGSNRANAMGPGRRTSSLAPAPTATDTAAALENARQSDLLFSTLAGDLEKARAAYFAAQAAAPAFRVPDFSEPTENSTFAWSAALLAVAMPHGKARRVKRRTRKKWQSRILREERLAAKRGCGD